MNFVHDQLATGRPFRVLTVVDQWSRQSPTLEVAHHFTRTDVRRPWIALKCSGKPVSTTVDHDTEFMSRALEDWAYHRGVQLDFTWSGKPTDNSYIKSFNGKLRDELLNTHQFVNLVDAGRSGIVRFDPVQRPG